MDEADDWVGELCLALLLTFVVVPSQVDVVKRAVKVLHVEVDDCGSTEAIDPSRV